MIAADLRETQMLVIEAGDTCNLADRHVKCPAHIGDRWRGATHEGPVPDDHLVALVVSAHLDHGFRGLVCFHYYSEPMAHIERIRKLAAAVTESVPEARFGLWTNGTYRLAPEDGAIFERAWVSRYDKRLGYEDIRAAIPETTFESGDLDERLTATGGHGPCWRPFIELVIDYRGYVHVCCVAYHADEAIGHVLDEDFGEIVQRYAEVRRGLAVNDWPNAPGFCRDCGSRVATLYGKAPLVAALALVKDEIDILPTWWAHYRDLADLLIVTDNGSLDGTREWLAEREAEEPACIVLDEPGTNYQQGEWTTRMMHLAREHGCRWVIPADADELWCPAGGRRGLLHLLARHANSPVLHVSSYTYRATPRDDQSEPNPVRRLPHREQTPDREWGKVLVRTDPEHRITLGNHAAEGPDGTPLTGAVIDPSALHIRHYPERSWEHWRRKVISGGEMYEHCAAEHPHGTGYHWRQPYQVYCQQGLAGLWHLWRRDHVREAEVLVHDLYDAGGSAGPAVVLTCWGIPAKRLAEHFAWNDASYREARARVIVVTDAHQEHLPGYVEELVLDHRFSREVPFCLAWTSNVGIRRAIALGCDPVVKTDVDCAWPDGAFTKALQRSRPRIGDAPVYRLARSLEEARASRAWRASCGTVCLRAEDWKALRGYDERLRGYGVEDGDLVLRARAAGIAVSRGLHIVHVASDLTDQSSGRRHARWNAEGINPDREKENQAIRQVPRADDAPWGGPAPEGDYSPSLGSLGGAV